MLRTVEGIKLLSLVEEFPDSLCRLSTYARETTVHASHCRTRGRVQGRVMPSHALNDDVRLLHKLINGKLTPTKEKGVFHTRTGCRDSLLVTGIILL